MCIACPFLCLARRPGKTGSALERGTRPLQGAHIRRCSSVGRATGMCNPCAPVRVRSPLPARKGSLFFISSFVSWGPTRRIAIAGRWWIDVTHAMDVVRSWQKQDRSRPWCSGNHACCAALYDTLVIYITYVLYILYILTNVSIEVQQQRREETRKFQVGFK